MNLQDFLDSRVVRQAVERNLTVIGITAGRLRDTDGELYNSLEELRQAVGLRNRLAHGYGDDVDDEVIWNVVHRSIPELVEELESAIASI